jgi:hypothetical protein
MEVRDVVGQRECDLAVFTPRVLPAGTMLAEYLEPPRVRTTPVPVRPPVAPEPTPVDLPLRASRGPRLMLGLLDAGTEPSAMEFLGPCEDALERARVGRGPGSWSDLVLVCIDKRYESGRGQPHSKT